VPPKSVATVGDVSATPGTTPYTGADSGAWTAGPISYTSYVKVASGGAKAISEARCTFSFSGANSSSGATITGTETVTLRAGPTKLQKGEAGVIVDGDSETGSFGNKLSAASGEPLKTT
jgi:hypothetical protein